MAIKFTAFDANNDGAGIDVTAYFLDFDTNFASTGYGWFSEEYDSDYKGGQYATTEQNNLIPNGTKQAVIFDAGGAGDSIDYSIVDHSVAGDLYSMSFGYGLGYNSGTDEFTFMHRDILIEGFNFLNQVKGSTLEALIAEAMDGNILTLTSFLDANEIYFVGSSGSDSFKGYSKDDKIIGGAGDDNLSGGDGNDALFGGAGNDTLDGGAGNDTYVYDGVGTDVIAAGFETGAASNDVIRITKGFSDFATLLAATTDVGADAVIDFGGGNTLTITGVAKANLHEDDFSFGFFDDGVSPLVADDAGSTIKDLKTVIDVLANDEDADGGTLDPATVTIVDGPDNGAVLVDTSTGKITYTPTVGYSGSDSFTYTVKDNDGNISGEAKVTIDVAAGHTLTSGDDVFSGDSLGLKFSGIEVHGGAGHDYIVTSNQAAHPDKIYGDDGNDVIFTGGGNDYVDGGAGDDVIHGRAGTDTLIGGTGNDTFVVRMTDAGTTTITDDDGVLFHGTFRPATYPASWSPAPGATNGFAINGAATLVSPGVYNLAVTDNTSTLRNFTLNWTGGDLTITEAGKAQTVVIEDYVNGTFDITLPPPNAADDTGSTIKDLKTVIDVLANDEDFDGTLDPATVTIVDGPDNGSVLVDTSTGKITYTPTVGYSGSDSFTYTVKDNDGNVSGEATVTIDVAAGHTLTSGDDVFSGDSLGLKFSGIEVHGGAGHDYIVTSNQAAHPDVIYGDDGNDVIFTGGGNDYVDGGAGDDVIHGRAGTDTLIGGTGDDTFVVRMTDAGTTTIKDNDGTLFHGTFRPATYPASWSPAPGATNGFEISGNATFVSPGVFNLAVTDNTSTLRNFTLNWTGGDLTITETGKAQTVVIEDYDNGTFGILLPAPDVADDTGSTIKDLKTVVDVLANDTDLDGTLDPATVTIVDGPDNGSVLVDTSTGKITYTPTVGYSGTDSFTYTVKDDDGNISGEAKVTIDVAAGHTLTSGDDVFSGDSLGLKFSGIEVHGGAGHDYIVTSNQAAHPDKIYGDDGNDVIFTGGGNDYVDGGAGDDVIHGRAGTDTLIGGTGSDTFVVRMTDAGTTTIVDNDGTLFHGTFRPAAYPASWSPAPGATSGFEISGTATFVSAGVFNLAVTDNTSTLRNFTLSWTGGDLTITETGKAQTVVIEDYVNGTFGITLGTGNTIVGTTKNDTINGTTTPAGQPFASNLSDEIFGGDGNDIINALGGNDKITGGKGNDTISGGDGNDIIYVEGTDGQSDTLDGGNGIDTLEATGATAITLAGFKANNSIERLTGNNQAILGTTAADVFDFTNLIALTKVTYFDAGAGNDTFKTANGIDGEYRGGAGNDTFTGGTGKDTFEGGAGVDTLNGGDGNDTLVVSGTNDTTDVLNGGNGTDTLKVTGATALTLASFDATAQSIEIWSGNGAGLVGTTAANKFDLSGLTTVTGLTSIDGGTGNDTLIGSNIAGLTLIGGAGVDTVTGGSKDDTIVLSGTNDTTDVISGGGGTDTIQVIGTTAVTLNSFNATAQSFEVWAGNNKELLGTTGANTLDLSGLTSVSGLTFVNGLAGNDVITGTDAVSLDLRGDAGDDTLNAGAAGDTLTGGAGKDTLNGGAGNDTLVISGTLDTTDVLNGNGGTDTIKVAGTTTVTLAALDTVGSSIEVWAGNNKELLGTTAANTFDLSNLTSVTGLTFVNGLAGNDIITGSNSVFMELRGDAGDDTLNAGAAGAILNGGAGNDTLNGGVGDDTFIGGAGADIIIGGGGIDTVSYAGSAAVVVNLRTGFASGGDANGDKLTGIRNVIGTSGNDTITASAAGSVITGGAGIDTLLGGVGDDTFIISGTNDASDIRDGNAGNDTIKIVGSNATLNGFVGAYEDVENFDGGGFSLLGTAAANTFDFTGVTVTNLTAVDGLAGNDVLIGSDLSGMTLIGGAGVDIVTGGSKDDTIVVSGTNDTTDTLDGGGGTDTLKVNGTTALTLAGFDATAQSIEVWAGNNKELLGTAANNTFDLSGLTGVTGLTFVDGGAGNDVIKGTNAASLELRGGAGNDTITAGSAGDTIVGGAGIDTLNGGNGNDTFVISGSDGAADIVNGNGGTDTIKATGAVTLNGFDTVASSIEAWVGTTKAGINGSSGNDTFDLSNLASVTNLHFVDGGAGNDTLIGSDNWAGDLRGGAGNDRIQGGNQVDTLSGGAGNDTFVFIDAAQGRDVFTDFANGDKLEFGKVAFGGGLELLADGTLADASFLVVGAGATANNASHGQFVYDTTTDILSWDADGSGAGAAVEIGKFGSSVVLKLADFTLV